MTSDERAAQAALIEAMTSHTVWLQRAATAQVNESRALLDTLAGRFYGELSSRLDNLTQAERMAFMAGRYHTSRLKGLRNVIERFAETLDSDFRQLSIDGLERLAGYEAGYARDLIARVTDGDVPDALGAAVVMRQAMQTPVFGQMVDELLADVSERTRNQVYSRLRQGFADGDANSNIVRALRGTKALGFKDGVLNWTQRNIETAVRTARAHTSNVAYDESYRVLGVREVRFSATLDMRTTKRCAALDGAVFDAEGQHPKPPLHYNCRSQLVPHFDSAGGKRPFVSSLKVRSGYRFTEDGERVARSPHYRSIGNMTAKQREDAKLKVGQVDASTSYAQWLKRQPAEAQREWLGESRYKLWRDGNYELSRFSDPRTGREYSLDELRARDRATFADIFGN